MPCCERLHFTFCLPLFLPSQARDTYFAGVPLVADEYFDRIEARLEAPAADGRITPLAAHSWYLATQPTTLFWPQEQLNLLGSDVVRKWPRCSLQRKRTYSDIRVDSGQLSTLAGVWALIFALFGVIPVLAGVAHHLCDTPRAMAWSHEYFLVDYRHICTARPNYRDPLPACHRLILHAHPLTRCTGVQLLRQRSQHISGRKTTCKPRANHVQTT